MLKAQYYCAASLDGYIAETDGITTVSFTHSGLWDEEAVRSHEGGWGRLFDSVSGHVRR